MHKDGEKFKMARALETSDSYMYMRWLFKKKAAKINFWHNCKRYMQKTNFRNFGSI